MSRDLNLCQVEKALSHYRSGGTAAEFSEMAGISKSSGLKWLSDNGHKRPSRGRHAKTIRLLWEEGMTVSEIAEKVPLTAFQVRRTLIRQGIFEPHRHAKGVRINTNGYVEYTVGPHKGRCVHVVEMEKFIGRRIKEGETVHHIDGDKTNNTLENLAFCTNRAHARIHRLQEIMSGHERRRDGSGRFL